jgi:hypothetical protein
VRYSAKPVLQREAGTARSRTQREAGLPFKVAGQIANHAKFRSEGHDDAVADVLHQ